MDIVSFCCGFAALKDFIEKQQIDQYNCHLFPWCARQRFARGCLFPILFLARKWSRLRHFWEWRNCRQELLHSEGSLWIIAVNFSFTPAMGIDESRIGEIPSILRWTFWEIQPASADYLSSGLLHSTDFGNFTALLSGIRKGSTARSK